MTRKSLYTYLLNIWRGRFFRNVALVASGTAGAQIITAIFAPIIARIYGPESFGLLGAFTAIISVVTPLAALAYPTAIVLPRDDRVALGLVRLSISISLVVSLLAATFIAVGGGWLTTTLGVVILDHFLMMIPFVMLLSAWAQIIQQWLIRKQEFGVIARTAVVHSFIFNMAKAGAGWLHPVGAVLVVLAALGPVLQASLLFLGAQTHWPTRQIKLGKESKISMLNLAYQHRDFPLYRATQNFINASSQSLPVLILTSFYGPIAAGYYVLSKMVLGMPTALVGNAVKDVIYPNIAEAYHEDRDIFWKLLRATLALALISIFPFVLVVIYAPWFFNTVFGENWVIAGEYTRCLAPFFLLNLINRPSVAAVPVLGIQRGLLLYEVLSTGAKFGGLIIGVYWLESDVWAVALFSTVGTLAYSIMIIWILSYARKKNENGKASR